MICDTNKRYTCIHYHVHIHIHVIVVMIQNLWNSSRNCIDGLVQERRSSIALAMELRLSCTNSSIWYGHRVNYKYSMSNEARSGQSTSRALCKPLRWRHNGHDGVSNHQPHHCLLNRLFGCRSKKTSKLRVTGLCAGNSPGTVHKWPVTRKMFPFDDVIMRVVFCCVLWYLDGGRFTPILQGFFTSTYTIIRFPNANETT